jgi:hypothetical protein
VKEVWQGMQKITRYSMKNKVCKLHDFKDECNTVLRSGNFYHLAVQEPVSLLVKVCKQLKKISVNKSAGPNGNKTKI